MIVAKVSNGLKAARMYSLNSNVIPEYTFATNLATIKNNDGFWDEYLLTSSYIKK